MGSFPTVGQAAPPFEIEDGRGERLTLATFHGRPLALVFLRHLGCPICRRELADLVRRQDELAARGAAVLVLVDSPDESVRAFAARPEVRFHLAGDPRHAVYDAYGVARGGIGGYVAPGALARALAATVRGHLHGRFEGSELQLPADFVIDAGGRIAWAHRGRHIGDNAPLDELLAALDGALSGGARPAPAPPA